MRALVCTGPGEAALREVEEPVPGPGEIVVHVGAALTCGTDLKILRRGHPKLSFPIVLGHEVAGIVTAVGEGAMFAPGDRVTSAVTAPCGRCGECAAGREHLCETAFDAPLWGAFADLVRIPARIVAGGVRALPDALAFSAAALLDPVAACLHGVSRLPRARGGTHLIAGTGPIAMILALLLRGEGAERVVIAGRRAKRLARFREAGFETVALEGDPLSAAARRALGGRGADVVLDAAGAPALVPELVAAAAHGGTVLVFSGLPRGASVPVDAGRLHYDEVSLVGSFHYTPAEASRALALVASGAFPAEALVTGTALLSDWADAFARTTEGDDLKVALVP